MPSDVITLAVLSSELDKDLKGARIDKIYQPEEDEITLSVYTTSGNKLLVISASPNLPRLHFTKAKKENPINAPTFCMLLRKHLTSSRIEKVELYGMDRNIRFTIKGKNEMADDTLFYLYVELMGRYSNIILANSDNKILDVLRRVPLDATHTRKLLPTMTYSPAEQNKISILDSINAKRVLDSTGRDFQEIMKNLSGFSKETLSELLFLTENSNSFSEDFLLAVNDFIQNPSPIVTLSNDSPNDFFARAYTSNPKPFISAIKLSDAIDLCVSEKDKQNRIKSKSKRYLSLIKNAISRNEKKLGANLDKLIDCEKAEELKVKGEVLTAYLYLVQKGSSTICLPNFYDENCAEITITLDPTKTPSQNAQNYFRRYVKLKRTKDTVIKMVSENRETLNYLKSLLFDVENCTIESDLKDIEQNLISFGLIAKQRNQKVKLPKPGKPTKYIFNGIEIYVGRNNVQNDALTFDSALKSDTWFHVKNFHGSHVVVRSGKDLTSEVIQFAGELAAFYSEAKQSSKVDVDYTKIKYVKRSPLKRLGLVVYTDFSTVCVTPNEHKNYITE